MQFRSGSKLKPAQKYGEFLAGCSIEMRHQQHSKVTSTFRDFFRGLFSLAVVKASASRYLGFLARSLETTSDDLDSFL